MELADATIENLTAPPASAEDPGALGSLALGRPHGADRRGLPPVDQVNLKSLGLALSVAFIIAFRVKTSPAESAICRLAPT